ncbi:MAG: hypothetical protein ACI8PZ_000668 [Myxococcota bacterium]|jgi:hypothetical protein
MNRLTQEDGNPFYVLGLPLGGLILGFGVVSLYYSFGWAVGALNQNINLAGFTGIDELGVLPAADYSIGLIVLGVLLMVFLNATAWRRTGGY